MRSVASSFRPISTLTAARRYRVGGLVVDADHWPEESTREIAPASGPSPGGRRPQRLLEEDAQSGLARSKYPYGIRSTEQLRESGARAAAAGGLGLGTERKSTFRFRQSSRRTLSGGRRTINVPRSNINIATQYISLANVLHAVQSPFMNWGSEVVTLQAVPTPVGDGWRILIEWVSGRIQYISGFETIQDAESWIEKNARTWILNTRHRL